MIGRLGKSRTQETRFKNQDMRAKYLKANPEVYFNSAVKAIIVEEALYNECMDYVLFRLNISQEMFFDLQSIYMSDASFCESLTKLDMETLPIEEEKQEMADRQLLNKKECKLWF